MKRTIIFVIFLTSLVFFTKDLNAQVAYVDSAEIDAQVMNFITDTSTYSYVDADDSNKVKWGKVDRMDKFNRHVKVQHITALSDSIVAITKKEVVYKVNVYVIGVDEYGRFDFDEVIGGSGTAQFFDNDDCIKRPLVWYNWRFDPNMPGYLYIDVVTGYNNCYY